MLLEGRKLTWRVAPTGTGLRGPGSNECLVTPCRARAARNANDKVHTLHAARNRTGAGYRVSGTVRSHDTTGRVNSRQRWCTWTRFCGGLSERRVPAEDWESECARSKRTTRKCGGRYEVQIDTGREAERHRIIKDGQAHRH